jgi:hypothetical protein
MPNLICIVICLLCVVNAVVNKNQYMLSSFLFTIVYAMLL